MNEHTSYCSAFNLDSSETVAYNNPLFPFYAQYGFLSHYPNYSAVSHWHNDLEFIFIKKGYMTYNVNGNLIDLYENNGIMVNSRQIHYGFSAKHQECEFICILLSPELLQGSKWFYHNYVEYITENASCPYLYLSSNDWQSDILEKTDMLYNLWQNENKSYFKVIELFSSMMEILYKNLSVPQQTLKNKSSEITSLKNMITYIEEHFTEHITLDSIAFSGACCKSRCSLLFKKYLRDTPVSYITKFRLRKSLAALLESDLSITEIAYEYGFGGASYYCETFRKYYGISPLQYRKEQLGIMDFS
ncbi:MAG: AraC family transcriptional regulator [Clostridium sp.]|nr:AraC family transcriptional regulator [Clostridium sp.]